MQQLDVFLFRDEVAPDRADGMHNVLARQFSGSGVAALASLHYAVLLNVLGRFILDRRPALAGDRPRHASPMREVLIGRIRDRVSVFLGDVLKHDLYFEGTALVREHALEEASYLLLQTNSRLHHIII